MTTIEQWLTKFSQDKKPSEHTVRAYKTSLMTFGEFMETQDIFYATEEDIRAYISNLETKGLSRASIYYRLSPLKLYFKMLHGTGQIETDPFASIYYVIGKQEVNRQNADSERKMLSAEQIHKLLSFNWELISKNKYTQIRNKLIIYLLVDTGRRVSDICQILKYDIFEDYILFEKTKSTNGQGRSPISKITRSIIDEYLLLSQSQSLNKKRPQEYLFDVYEDSIRLIVKDLLAAIGIEKHRLNAHMIRHYVVTSMVQKGIDGKTISKITGMSPITMMTRYCHPSNEHLKKCHEIASIIDGNVSDGNIFACCPVTGT